MISATSFAIARVESHGTSDFKYLQRFVKKENLRHISLSYLPQTPGSS